MATSGTNTSGYWVSGGTSTLNTAGYRRRKSNIKVEQLACPITIIHGAKRREYKAGDYSVTEDNVVTLMTADEFHKDFELEGNYGGWHTLPLRDDQPVYVQPLTTWITTSAASTSYSTTFSMSTEDTHEA